MNNKDLINSMHCPCCGAHLEIELEIPGPKDVLEHGILKCACYRYPVIYGIIMLQQFSGAITIKNQVIDFLAAGNIDGAFQALIRHCIPITGSRTLFKRLFNCIVQRLTRLITPCAGTKQNSNKERQLLKALLKPDLGLYPALKQLRSVLYADYLYQRYANPSFIASIPVMSLLHLLLPGQGNDQAAECQILDLACGIGHSTFLLHLMFPEYSIIPVDYDFINLFLLHKYFINRGPAVCLDLEYPLPFADDTFQAVFSLDAYHYIHSKLALACELDRVVDNKGMWLFPHLHNADGNNLSPGIPLPVAHYLRCFSRVDARVFSEKKILGDFMNRQTLDLSCCLDKKEWENTDVLCLIGSRERIPWSEYEHTGRLISRAVSTLTVNPIYRQQMTGNRIRLQIHWPNPSLEVECESIKNFLPATCEIDNAFYKRLTGNILNKDDLLLIRKLVNKLILVALPENYRSDFLTRP